MKTKMEVLMAGIGWVFVVAGLAEVYDPGVAMFWGGAILLAVSLLR